MDKQSNTREQSNETREDLPTNPWNGRAAERYEHTNRNRLGLPPKPEQNQ